MKLPFKLSPSYYLPEWLTAKYDWTSRARLRMFILLTASAVVVAVMVYCVLHYSGTYYALFCFPFAAVVASFGNRPRSDTRPLKFGIQYWIFSASIIIAPLLIAASYYTETQPYTFMPLFLVGYFLIFFFTVAGAYLFKITPETRETDAVVWLLKRTASEEPSYFQKAGQISKQPTHKYEGQQPADSKYDHRQACLLTSLLPLLLSLITSKIQYRASQKEGFKDPAFLEKESDDLTLYVACLSQLSAFDDSPGSPWENQSAIVHPTLSTQDRKLLADALQQVSKLEGESNALLSSAARDALKYYRVGEKSEGQESV